MGLDWRFSAQRGVGTRFDDSFVRDGGGAREASVECVEVIDGPEVGENRHGGRPCVGFGILYGLMLLHRIFVQSGRAVMKVARTMSSRCGRDDVACSCSIRVQVQGSY